MGSINYNEILLLRRISGPDKFIDYEYLCEYKEI